MSADDRVPCICYGMGTYWCVTRREYVTCWACDAHKRDFAAEAVTVLPDEVHAD